MATKKKKTEDTGVLPVDFFGDVVEQQASGLIAYEYKYGDHAVEIKCKRSLNYKEKAGFVDGIWEAYYSADAEGHRDYRPYLIELCIRFFTVKYYCVNVPLDDGIDIGMYENFLTNTDFYDVLLQHINLIDYKFLINATYSYLDKMVALHAATVRSNADITLNEIMSTILDLLSGVDKDRFKDLLVANSLFSEDNDENQRDFTEGEVVNKGGTE